MVGLAKSGFLSGFGAVATPLLAMVVPVPQAAAILLPLLIVMDITSVQQLWRDRDADLLKLLVPAGLLGTVVGTALFSLVSVAVVECLVGALTLLFLLQRLWGKAPSPEAALPSQPLQRRWLGRCLALTSGFTSFVAHAGGPPLTAYVLPLKMQPIRVVATMAVFFSFINASKILPYAWLGLLDGRNLLTSLVLAPVAPLGVWLGVWLSRRISASGFYRIAYLGMALTGGKLLWDGARHLV